MYSYKLFFINIAQNDIIDFYDIAVNLTQNEGEMIDYPAIGQKAKNSKVFNWVLNKEVSDSEE